MRSCKNACFQDLVLMWSLSHLAADGVWVLHRHHQVTSQEVKQDISDIRAQRLQDVFGN